MFLWELLVMMLTETSYDHALHYNNLRDVITTLPRIGAVDREYFHFEKVLFGKLQYIFTSRGRNDIGDCTLRDANCYHQLRI